MIVGQARHRQPRRSRPRQVTRAVKRRLKQIQYRPDLVHGCLAGTDLIMDG
ncbi:MULTISPECIES: hypothetical protein [unclassified Streptomyces]|uniref:hypothetical protein n=1 Tax=unclassified Streptomyces TaxID=2593676 RepID=UPI003654EE9C